MDSFASNVEAIRDMIAIAGSGVSSEERNIDGSPLGIIDEHDEIFLTELVDGLENNIESSGLARSYMRRQFEAVGLDVEDYFDAWLNDPECGDPTYPISVMADACWKFRNEEVNEESAEEHKESIMTSTLAALYCTAFSLPLTENIAAPQFATATA